MGVAIWVDRVKDAWRPVYRRVQFRGVQFRIWPQAMVQGSVGKLFSCEPGCPDLPLYVHAWSLLWMGRGHEGF